MDVNEKLNELEKKFIDEHLGEQASQSDLEQEAKEIAEVRKETINDGPSVFPPVNPEPAE